jgi:hypothetical protein
MNRYTYFLNFWLTALSFLFCSCNNFEKEENKEVEFIIYSQKVDPYNDLYATIYVSDTNWAKIAKFADSLVQGYGFLSVIKFYPDSSNVPTMDENYNFVSNRDSEALASYIVPNANRIFEEKNTIDQTKELMFKLFTINDKTYNVKTPYVADFHQVNDYIKYHNNYDNYKSSTLEIAELFIKLLLENKLNEIPSLFSSEIDEKEIDKLHGLLFEAEWDKIKIVTGENEKKYNLWFIDYNLTTDSDSLKVKVHFDVNNSPEKIQKIEYFYYN